MPAVVVSVNYRLAPENRFPGHYDDGLEVVRWIANAGKQHGGDGKRVLEKDGFLETADTSRCFLVGDSAGGAPCGYALFIKHNTEVVRETGVPMVFIAVRIGLAT
ncbi:hypothetical protein AMTR_s00099p00100660 [Amborella trichopoda]|uniref:Alpha/beta hydrolase fold-3 domain-containing protein n=1 Tax=Amborella trichopoda TaxID=13333 RepID=W1NWT2_AMBTC|nr:hypothetical protein AMTR_s00099p00100660 [Amborella trichopoda]